MQITAQQLFKEIDSRELRPYYLIVGEEPFQIGEILERLKTRLVPADAADFQYEAWEGEGLDGGSFKASLEELPGLFSGPDSLRLVVARNFERAPVGALEIVESYLKDPVASTLLVMVASKVDKRKNWYRTLDQQGGVLEVSEPQDREWPKWHGYLERKSGKRIEPEAWERLVASSQKRLSTLWTEIQKTTTFVGDAPQIRGADVALVAAGEAGEDIFALAEDVLLRRAESAFRRFHRLLKEGESEIKILSILVRQFRIVQQYRALAKKGVTDSKVIGPQIGVHPYFVSKVAAQAKAHNEASLQRALVSLADADYWLKTGTGGVFETFLVPYFGSHAGSDQKAQ